MIRYTQIPVFAIVDDIDTQNIHKDLAERVAEAREVEQSYEDFVLSHRVGGTAFKAVETQDRYCRSIDLSQGIPIFRDTSPYISPEQVQSMFEEIIGIMEYIDKNPENYHFITFDSETDEEELSSE